MKRELFDHALSVAAHIIGSMLVACLGYLLFSPDGTAQLVKLLTHYGLSVGVINVIIAVAVRYFQMLPEPPDSPETPQQ